MMQMGALPAMLQSSAQNCAGLASSPARACRDPRRLSVLHFLAGWWLSSDWLGCKAEGKRCRSAFVKQFFREPSLVGCSHALCSDGHGAKGMPFDRTGGRKLRAVGVWTFYPSLLCNRHACCHQYTSLRSVFPAHGGARVTSRQDSLLTATSAQGETPKTPSEASCTAGVCVPSYAFKPDRWLSMHQSSVPSGDQLPTFVAKLPWVSPEW